MEEGLKQEMREAFVTRAMAALNAEANAYFEATGERLWFVGGGAFENGEDLRIGVFLTKGMPNHYAVFAVKHLAELVLGMKTPTPWNEDVSVH